MELRLSWSRRFEEPIELPDGRKLKTLAEAIAWLAKEIPKSEHKMEKVQTAAHLVTRVRRRNHPVLKNLAPWRFANAPLLF